jgi:hypothetical protein
VLEKVLFPVSSRGSKHHVKIGDEALTAKGVSVAELPSNSRHGVHGLVRRDGLFIEYALASRGGF